MKKNRTPLDYWVKSISIICLLILSFTSCEKRDIHQVIREMAEMPVDTAGFYSTHLETNNFTLVEVDCFADVTFTQTKADEGASITIKSSKEVLENVKTKVEDGKLRVTVNRRYRMPEKAIVVAEIKAPIVNKFVMNGTKCLRIDTLNISSPLEVEMDGVGSLVANNINAYESKILLNGDGHIHIKDIKTGHLQTALNGGGGITVGGECTDIVALLVGEGKMNFAQLKSETPIAQTINGTGTITVPKQK
ncbi:MAG: DUF2807 domain-containing protein [Bacteroidaceae bacterium]|nr:DUF2807 domain-containing protein [Bacteroidaceae bacterium]